VRPPSLSLPFIADHRPSITLDITHTQTQQPPPPPRRTSIHNCHFRAGDASDIFAGIGHLPGRETAVIIDPPRKGCDADFLNQLFAFRPARVVYVSCDPATQARDARAFIDAGYAMEDIQIFDMFPMTRAIENVIVFRDDRFSAPGQARPVPLAAAAAGGGGTADEAG
jgi:hypothetical protein